MVQAELRKMPGDAYSAIGMFARHRTGRSGRISHKYSKARKPCGVPCIDWYGHVAVL